MERYAIIDLGSNSVRMNIVHINKDGSYTLLDQAKEWCVFQKIWDLKKP